jgi:hypothetical protein
VRRGLTFVLLSVVFGVSYTQLPLYASNQNQYFLHGLASSGVGLLRHDWLANTVDPTPVFSFLVGATERYLHRAAFYVYFLFLLGLYVWSLLGIASSLFRIHGSRSKYLTYLAAIILIYAPIFASPLAGYLPASSAFAHWPSGSIAGLVSEGVADVSILDHFLVPSTFGALLLVSIHFFLRGAPLAAVASSSLAAVVHPIYLLSAGVLAASYLIAMVRRGESARKVVAVALCALALALPILIYTYIAFRPTSPGVWSEAHDVLVHFRSPHHMLPEVWIGPAVLIKGAITLLALYLTRRTELFWPLALPFVVAVGLTAAQVLSRSDDLAVALPWRLSAFLVPVSFSVVLAHLLSRLHDRVTPASQKLLAEFSIAVLGVLVGMGAVTMAQQFHSEPQDGSGAVTRFVSATKSPGDTYLVPVVAHDVALFEKFRVGTGAPTFIDFKSIPYKDTEVMEWYKRVRLADAFFRARGDARCRLLRESLATYNITHVVLRTGDPDGCGDWKLLFKDPMYQVMMVPR